MSALSLSIDAIKPLNRWDYDSIRPGKVGSVGDVLITERLKASRPGDFIMDNAKLLKAQNVYNRGYNTCAQLCNFKLDFYKQRCALSSVDVPDNIPVIMNVSQ